MTRLGLCLTFMLWFSSSKPEPPTAASREDRQKCWESRDAYFACLDAAGVVKAGEENNACSTQATHYEQNCAKSWVRYSISRFLLFSFNNDITED